MPLTDVDMHNALATVLKTLDRPNCPVSFVNEGLFTSIRRMRTLMDFSREHIPPPKGQPSAARLELRGEWHYPIMMMNDCQPRDPDPPKIMVLDASGVAVARFNPKTTEEVHALLEQILEGHRIDERVKELNAQEANQRAIALEAQQTALRTRTAIQTTIHNHAPDIAKLAAALAAVTGRSQAAIVQSIKRAAEYACA